MVPSSLGGSLIVFFIVVQTGLCPNSNAIGKPQGQEIQVLNEISIKVFKIEEKCFTIPCLRYNRPVEATEAEKRRAGGSRAEIYKEKSSC